MRRDGTRETWEFGTRMISVSFEKGGFVKGEPTKRNLDPTWKLEYTSKSRGAAALNALASSLIVALKK